MLRGKIKSLKLSQNFFCADIFRTENKLKWHRVYCIFSELLKIVKLQAIISQFVENTAPLHCIAQNTQPYIYHCALIIHMLLSVMTTKKVLPLNYPTAVKSVKHQRINKQLKPYPNYRV